MIDAVARYVRVKLCPWHTALEIAGVSPAEDVRWRDAVEGAEAAGAEPPPAEAEWYELWQSSRDLVADVAGALTKTAKTAGKDGVAAARAVLAVEAGGAWGERSGGRGEAEVDEASAVDEVAIERLSAAQRRRVAELALAVRDARDELEQIMRDARSGR